MEQLKEFFVNYLANVVMVSHIDGHVAPEEEQAIEMIRCGIGAGQAELKQAVEKVKRVEHVITPVGRFSDRVRNFEDMLLMALIDNELVLPEKTEVLAFAKTIGLSQDQINIILSETRKLIAQIQGEGKCPSCGKEQPIGGKYCIACGDRI
jgi:hypothetical protein